jgi:ATP-dependent Zn protease
MRKQVLRLSSQVTVLVLLLLSISDVSRAFQSPSSPLRPLSQVRTSSKLANFQLNRRPDGVSPLFSSPDGSESNKRKNPLKLLSKAARKAANKLSAGFSKASARFAKLSKRAKVIVCLQLLIMSLLMGGYARSSQARKGTAPVELPFSQFMDIVERESTKAGSTSAKEDDLHILDLKIGADRLGFQIARGATPEQLKALREYKEGKNPSIPIPSRLAYTRKVAASPELIDYLRSNKIPFQAASMSNASAAGLAARGMMLMFYLLFMLRMMKNMSGGSESGPGKLANMSELPLASFSEVQGIDGAKFEVMELVDTLRNPDKYAIMGARAPKGLLLEGPPGTGKTLLARATASTAGVPLLYCSGSDFVEMFVGRGAARVRKTFDKAKKLAPCLIFIDELDALGKSRETGMMAGMRGNDEAEQTLNQLLACMDGLDSKGSQICVMAATNRREVLDSALLRPGRFDRIVRLELPDALGREAILRVHAKKLPGFKECSGLDGKSGM